MGRWLKTNGDAIYGTRYWKVCEQKDGDLVFTTKGTTLYATKLVKPSAPKGLSRPTARPLPARQARIPARRLTSSARPATISAVKWPPAPGGKVFAFSSRSACTPFPVRPALTSAGRRGVR